MGYTEDAPVIIAGAGSVGLSVALGLARCGVRSVLVEQNAGLAPYSGAILITPRTLEIFQEWGVADILLRTGIFKRDVTLYEAPTSRPLISFAFDDLRDITEHAGVLLIPQDRTERILLDVVMAIGACDVRFKTRLVSFRSDEEGVTVQADADGSRVEIRGRFLVGCDGAHSTVRQQLGLVLDGKTYSARVLLADVLLPTATSLPNPRLAMHAKGPLVTVRFDEERWRIIGTLEPDESEDRAATRESIARRLHLVAGDIPFELLWAGTFTIHNRTAERFQMGRTLLAGDAAHLSSPAGGMGMNSGIQDAHNLCWKLAAVLSGANTGELLSSYEGERRHAIVENVERVSDFVSRRLHFAPGPVRRMMIRLFGTAFRVRPMRRRFLMTLAMLGTRYPRSAFVEGDFTWAGRIAPNCEIGKPGMRGKRLLRHSLGRWAIICYGMPALHVDGFEAVNVSVPIGQAFRNTWGVRGPFCAIVRPDGYVAWAMKRPSFADVAAAARSLAPISAALRA